MQSPSPIIRFNMDSTLFASSSPFSLPSSFRNSFQSQHQPDSHPSLDPPNEFTSPFKENPSLPSTSPMKSKEVYADRFIPVRGNMSTRQLLYDTSENTLLIPNGKLLSETEEKHIKYQSLLEGQVLGMQRGNGTMSSKKWSPAEKQYCIQSPSLKEMANKLLHFKTQTKEDSTMNISSGISAFPFDWNQFEEEYFEPERKIKSKPYKILDAPSLVDDYYLNLLDWSSKDVLAVALQDTVHLWSHTTGEVKRLCQLDSTGDIYTGLSWNEKSEFLAIGDSNGKVDIWDVNKMRVIRKDLELHGGRVACVAWNSNDILASGSKDKSIIIRDLRIKDSTIMKFRKHRQEVCGLKWAPNGYQLASGGNDNKLYVLNTKMGDAEACFTEHKAAVKAITWSPHQGGLLLSGGGNNDQTIKVWNTHTMKLARSINTGSQVCNMLFSKNSNELITTHGFSNNHIVVWNYPDLTKIGVMEGHTSRILHLALSPNGENIVTGAGANDETLRFWNVFPSTEERKRSTLIPSSVDLR